jgi:predicted nucleic acid-binding protein
MSLGNNPHRAIVSNSGPLISLDNIQDGFEFIAKLHRRIYIPVSVYNEVSTYTNLESHIGNLLEIRQINEHITFPGIERLDKGEIDAIRLALARLCPFAVARLS